ncbi:MAG: VWA domain-containing protein [Planctomycetota bacterium]|nr:VWA domain-containing protein [Planctomycetota bacterium]
MNKSMVGWAVAGLAVLCLSSRVMAGAEAADRLYEQVYGEESRSVQLSGEPEAAVAFAKKLVVDAQSLKDDPAFAVFMLGKAYEFGSKDVAGYPVAMDALKAILDRVPERKNEWRAKLLSLARLWCQKASPAVLPEAAEQLVIQLIRAGDEQKDSGNPVAAANFFSEAVQMASRNNCPSLDTARGRLQGAKQDSVGEKRRAVYEAALKANPKDATAARGLALFWILETDTPANALAYLERSGDEQLKKYGPLAVRSAADVGEPDLLGLGDWYWELALTATDTAKTRALGRASALYAKFLDVHPQKDGAALKARKRAEDVNKAMAAMGNGPLVMGPPGKAAGMGVKFFGEQEIAGENIRYACYVIDHSGSVLSAFDEIIKELKKSINGLHETQDFHVVFFAKDTFQECPSRRLIPASDTNKGDALTFLKEIRASGYGSSPIPALAAAFKAFRAVPARSGDGKVLYLLTDGDFDTSNYKYKGLAGNHAVATWLRDNNGDRSVHVYPIIMGERPDDKTVESMRKIASENGGEYHFVERKY